MVESWVLVEEQNAGLENLKSVSLANTKQLLVGSVSGSGVILHLSAESPAEMSSALLRIAQVPEVTQVFTLALRILQ